MLAPEQVDHYRREGWVLLGSILDGVEVESLKAAERRHRPDFGSTDHPNRTLCVSLQLCHRSAAVRRFAVEGSHIPAVVQLLGPDVALTHQQFITKLPDDPATTSDIPFHQDNGYGRLEPTTDVTVWVALDDTDEDNGCLWIVPRSHELGVIEHRGAHVNPFLMEAATESTPHSAAGIEVGDAIPLPMAAGEAVAFTGQTLHGSGLNRTDRERVGLFVRYCEPTVVMVTEGNRPVLDDPHSWMVAGESP